MLKFKYKAVIFDFDDTLVESRAQKWAQHTHVAKKHFNIDLKEETIREHWGKPIHILAAELYEHKDTWENIHPILRSTRNDFPKKIYDKSAETVETLVKYGIKVGILSAATKLDVTDDLTKLNFPIESLTIIQGAEDTLVHKPDPEVFLPVLEKLKEEGIGKDEIIYVGDSLADLEAAHGAGLRFIAVTTGLYSEEDFKKAGAKTIIKDIREVIKKVV